MDFKDLFMYRNQCVEPILPTRELTTRITNKIWIAFERNILYLYLSFDDSDLDQNYTTILRRIYVEYHEKVLAEINIPTDFLNEDDRYRCLILVEPEQKHLAFSFIEWICNGLANEVPSSPQIGKILDEFTREVNEAFTEELFSYRFVSYRFIEVTTEEQVKAISAAAAIPYEQCRTHIQSAIGKLAHRPIADYIGCALEAVHAVEALARIICANNATLSANIKELQTTLDLHPTIADSLKKFYAFRGETFGHSEKVDPVREKYNNSETALFVLVSASAWLSYLHAQWERSKAGS